MKFTEFESERLMYRKFDENDFSVVFEWHGDKDNMGYRRDGVKTDAETQEYLNWIIDESNVDECKNFWFAAVRKEDNILIGEGLIKDVPKKPEIGWLVGKNYWQNGYGTEIGNALLKYSFEVLGLHRVIAACHVENHASYKLMERIGMRREAYFVKERLYGSEWCDRYQYAILHEEWTKL
jgi:RimJ/RimL family protein N-acetyltransferase